MKKTTNTLEYSLKGEVTTADEDIILTQVVKKDEVEEDTLDLAQFKQDIVNFCIANMNKDIELKFSLKVIEQ